MQKVHDEKTTGSPESFFHMQSKYENLTQREITEYANVIECTENLRDEIFLHCAANLR